MSIRYIDPRRTNIFLDTCAFDPKYSPEDDASKIIIELKDREIITLILAHSNQKEISHPNTPKWVKEEASFNIYTINTQLTSEELIIKETIFSILAGDGIRENMRKDAEHIFEASKYGSYFVTTDKGILKRSDEIFSFCRVVILLPSQMLNIINEYLF